MTIGTRSAQSDRPPSPTTSTPIWMPFTPNRAFKASPRLIARAKDMHYYDADGAQLLDGTAGLWCTNAGHNRDPDRGGDPAPRRPSSIIAPPFQFAHPQAFELASRVAALAPADLDHVFFCNSGSEAVDTALKIALAYHQRARGRRAHPPDRARARLSRRRLRRHFGRRHGQQPQILRRRCSPASTICRRPTTASNAGLQQGRAGVGRASRRTSSSAS